MKNNKVNNAGRTIFLAAAVLILICVVVFKILHSPGDNIAGEITASSKTVFINDEEIPAYDYNDNIYITAENLELFGMNIEYKDKTFKVSSDKNYIITSNDISSSLINIENGTKLLYPDYTVYVGDKEVQGYAVGKYTLIPLNSLKVFGAVSFDNRNSYYCTPGDFTEKTFEASDSESASASNKAGFDPSAVVDSSPLSNGKIIVLDAGHGKSSSLMTESELTQYGWVYNSNLNQWGEWRHFKYNQKTQDCEGYGCSQRVTPNGSCWYPIGNGDRDTEPEINLNNCLAAKKYLENMGYTVRLTRSSNDENPSITQRLTYCYPDNDTSNSPDVLAFVCVHSNAGGGSGTSYIELSGKYDHPEIPDNYAEQSNLLGKYINDAVAAASGLSNNAPIGGEPELIAFCKSPVICAYLEIGFFDNSSDLQILNSSSDAIGKAIAEGIDNYFNNR